MQEAPPGSKAQRRVEQAREIAGRALQELRDSVSALRRDIRALSLERALRQLADEVSRDDLDVSDVTSCSSRRSSIHEQLTSETRDERIFRSHRFLEERCRGAAKRCHLSGELLHGFCAGP